MHFWLALSLLVDTPAYLQNHKMKLAVSYALAQSTKLSVVSCGAALWRSWAYIEFHAGCACLP